MSWGDIIPGTEEMPTYPEYVNWEPEGFMAKKRGIQHFGNIKYKGLSCYKIADKNYRQLESIGWILVKLPAGYAGYAYMQKPVA